MRDENGLWKLSPSGLYNFIGCPACFWVDQHVGRAPSLPLLLNDAMDAKLKSRYDNFRKKGMVPPEIEHLKLKLYPDLDQLDIWRAKKSVLQLVNEKDGYILAGKIDELLVNKKNELVIADYKSSGVEPKDTKLDYYRLQLNAYALLFKKAGHKVSNKAYLLNYYPKFRTNPSKSVELACKVIEADLDLSAFEKTLRKMVKFLETPYPMANMDCRTCAFQVKRSEVLDRKRK